MITPDLQLAASNFLAYFLQPLRLQSGGGPLTPTELAQIATQLGSELEITVGEFKHFAGKVPQCANITVPIQHALYVSNPPLQIAPGGPDGIVLTQPTVNASYVSNKYALRWLAELADIRLDSAQTIERILADLTEPVAASGATTPPLADGPTQPSARATRYSEAIAAIANRADFPATLDEVDSVPAGIDLTLPLFKELLRDFFTFDTDGNYYAKWWGSNEGSFPLETTEHYRRLNVQSAGLIGDSIFVLANVPANFGIPGHQSRVAGEFREFIVEIKPQETQALAFDTINSAVKLIEIDGSPARDHFDFCFFTAP